ncbi:MAG: SUMF1/EgtB/PvdO family nonheme iron enzyme [Spirochaetaceae bacterium]|jgi:formylglycine-generating enzyme required for sulfatase activity|nr:SUMF1/EgtB/PvdO family nonheme iron enzyme [Spirochaetaceae bacterium]
MRNNRDSKASPREVVKEQDAVRLPVLFGVRPGVYLAVIYGAALAVLLFFLFLYQGLSRPGSMLVLKSEPRGAAIRVDGVYFAAAPARVFVPKGERSITVVMEGFEPYQTKLDVKSRVFASLFFPKTIELDVKLKEQSDCAALVIGAREFAEWSFAESPTENWQIPLALSEGVYRSAPRTESGQLEASALIEAAARFLSNQASLKDLLRAKFLSASAGNAPSPVAALNAVHQIFDYMRRNPSFAVAVGEILNDKPAQILIESDVYPNLWQKERLEAQNSLFAQSGAEVSVGGVRFTRFFERQERFQIGSGALWYGDIKSFAIARDEVSMSVWNQFTSEVPEWRFENRDSLVESGLVTEEYLEPAASFNSPQAFFAAAPAYPAPAQSGISYYAAQAFCLWLNTKLPESLAAKYEIRLPDEAEWEYAAKWAEREGVTFTGRLWNWCRDEFAPNAYLSATKQAIASISSPERAVRGGSWANAAGAVIPEMRGSLPADTCSVFAGFKPVIALKSAASE